jgi:PAS domain S-box-containing protein
MSESFAKIAEQVAAAPPVESALHEGAFKSAFENATIGMVLADTDDRCLAANRTFCEMIGYSEAELLQLEFSSITHPSDLYADLENTRQLIANEVSAFQVNRRLLHKSGRVLWTFVSASSVNDAYGYPLYLIYQIQDISDRKHAETALHRSEANNETLLNALPDLVLHIESDGTLKTYHGPVDEDLITPSDDLIGKNIRPLAKVGQRTFLSSRL